MSGYTLPYFCKNSHDLAIGLFKSTPRIAMDIGANEGGYTQCFLDWGAEYVFAFEPVPNMFEKVAKRFEGDTRVAFHRTALSDKPGTLENVNVFNCWTLLPNEQPRLSNGWPMQAKSVEYADKPPFNVPVITIDGFISKMLESSDTGGSPNYLKIDVDGYELRVLRGGEALIEANRPPIQFELSYLPQLIGDSVEEMCYYIYNQMHYDVVSMDGKHRVETPQELISLFPWNTSFDVMLIPQEQVSTLMTLAI